MSVRDKVKQLESNKGKDDSQPQSKKFLFPGNKQRTTVNETLGIPQTRSKPSVMSEFEANLEEVWSVRKNIHHNGASSNYNQLQSVGNSGLVSGLKVALPIHSSLSASKFASNHQSYSRHGAVGTHQTEAAHGIGFDNSSNTAKTRRLPLHDNNSNEPVNLARSTRPAPSHSLVDTLKKQFDPVHQDEVFAPMVKRKRTFKSGGEGLRFTNDNHSNLFISDSRPGDHKMSYAQKMAEAHLKSTGLGQYTPKQSGYAKIDESDDGKSSKWRKVDNDNDEFSF